MQAKSINPYLIFGDKHKEALDTIGGNLPVSPDFNQLNEVFITSVYNASPDSPIPESFVQIFLFALLPNLYNSYVNGKMNGNIQYTEKQQLTINNLFNSINTSPPATVPTQLEWVEEQIAASGLTFEEQAPLFLAAQIAKSDFEYWLNQMEAPGIWQQYLDTDKDINLMFLPGYVSAAVQGALLAYGNMHHPHIEVLDLFTPYTGSVGLVAGKVVFGWAQSKQTT